MITQIAGLSTLLNLRRGNSDLDVEVLPPLPPGSGGNSGEGGGNNSEDNGDPVTDAGNLQVSYFIHDHLGNTRIIAYDTSIVA